MVIEEYLKIQDEKSVEYETANDRIEKEKLTNENAVNYRFYREFFFLGIVNTVTQSGETPVRTHFLFLIETRPTFRTYDCRHRLALSPSFCKRTFSRACSSMWTDVSLEKCE